MLIIDQFKSFNYKNPVLIICYIADWMKNENLYYLCALIN